MFVAQEPVPVQEGKNIIWIKPRMDVGTRGLVKDALWRLGQYSPGTRETALLVHNIVRWEGPAFEGVPCTEERIQKLDPLEPLVEQVLAEIDRRNLREAPDPKAADGASSTTNAGA